MTYKISEYLAIVSREGKKMIQCTKCGTMLCSATQHWKDTVPRIESPVSKAGYRRSSSGKFVMREYVCPKCATILDVEVALPQDESLYDEIDVSTIPSIDNS